MQINAILILRKWRGDAGFCGIKKAPVFGANFKVQSEIANKCDFTFGWKLFSERPIKTGMNVDDERDGELGDIFHRIAQNFSYGGEFVGFRLKN